MKVANVLLLPRGGYVLRRLFPLPWRVIYNHFFYITPFSLSLFSMSISFFWNLQSKNYFIKIPPPPQFLLFSCDTPDDTHWVSQEKLKIEASLYTQALPYIEWLVLTFMCWTALWYPVISIIELEKQGYLLAHYFDAFLYGREGKGSMPKLFSRVLGFGGGKRNNKQTIGSL